MSSRSRVPSVAIALVGVLDALALGGVLVSGRAAVDGEAASWVVAPGAARTVVGASLAVLALAAAFGFAKSPLRAERGVVLLAACGALTTLHARVVGAPVHNHFILGATLVGWLAGRGLAAARRADDETAHGWAEAGAAGGLGAVYVGAVSSKLLSHGFSWADGDSLRAIVASQHPIGTGSLLDGLSRWVVASPGVGLFFSIATLVVQASAVLYPLHPSTRAVVGTLLLGFHLTVFLTTPVLYVQAMILLLAFSYPWAAIVARLRSAKTG